MSLPRYPKYKGSSVDWFKRIPSHWQEAKFRHVFDESGERIETDVVGVMLSVSGYRGIEVKEYDDENRRRSDEDLVGYRIVRRGQLVVNTMWLNYAGLGVSDHEGHVSPAYRAYWISEDFNKRFVHHMMRSELFVRGYTKYLTGVRPNSLQMSREDLMQFPVLKPPYEEQSVIADFLDRETAKIDALIAEQERLLSLLVEKRQAVISHAVTKGLNPDLPMKDSGVAWMGEVPAHWEVLRVKHCILSIEQGWSPQCDGIPTETEDEWGVLKVGCVNGGIFNPVENKKLPIDLDARPSLAIRAGDVLVSRANTRELVGSSAVAPRDFERLLLCDKLYRIRTKSKRLLPAFLSSWLGSGPARSQIQLDASGASSSMLNIGQGSILEMLMPVPSISEQRDILGAIGKNISQLVMAQGLVERSIALLRERRSSLIAAAVTGQIDVREVA